MHCAEVRSVAAAPPRFLGPRFRERSERAINRTAIRSNVHCSEIRSVTAAPPRLLGPRFRGGNERGGGEKRRKSMEEPEKRERVLIWRRFISSFSRRRPGPRDHRALDGSQKDIKPPQPPRHGGCCSFKGTRASCQRKARRAEVRSVRSEERRVGKE